MIVNDVFTTRHEISSIPRSLHLHGHSTHFGLTPSIRLPEGRNSYSSHVRQGRFAMDYYVGCGRKRQGKTVATAVFPVVCRVACVLCEIAALRSQRQTRNRRSPAGERPYLVSRRSLLTNNNGGQSPPCRCRPSPAPPLTQVPSCPLWGTFLFAWLSSAGRRPGEIESLRGRQVGNLLLGRWRLQSTGLRPWNLGIRV